MYTFEFEFFPKEKIECLELEYLSTEYYRNMQEFIQFLVLNGQVLQSFQNSIIEENSYKYRVVATAKFALEARCFNKYSTNILKKINNNSQQDVCWNLIGKNIDAPSECLCDDIPWYVLRGDINQDASPLICGTCNLCVPLFILPKTQKADDYYDILCWQDSYTACDRLFTHGVGEKYAYRMMSSVKSELSLEGRRICSYLEKVMNKPVYYYLFKYYTQNKKNCPLCGREWRNHNGEFPYDYVCNECRLVSNDLV